MIGKMTWLTGTEGCNSIQTEENPEAVFVPTSAVEKADSHDLADGHKISYEVAVDQRRG